MTRRTNAAQLRANQFYCNDRGTCLTIVSVAGGLVNYNSNRKVQSTNGACACPRERFQAMLTEGGFVLASANPPATSFWAPVTPS